MNAASEGLCCGVGCWQRVVAGGEETARMEGSRVVRRLMSILSLCCGDGWCMVVTLMSECYGVGRDGDVGVRGVKHVALSMTTCVRGRDVK